MDEFLDENNNRDVQTVYRSEERDRSAVKYRLEHVFAQRQNRIEPTIGEERGPVMLYLPNSLIRDFVWDQSATNPANTGLSTLK